MREFADAMDWVNTVVFPLLGALALRTWLRRRSVPAAWLAASFGILGLIVLVALLLPEEPGDGGPLLKTAVAVLILFPYTLFRFATSFSGSYRRLHVVATASLVAALLATALTPSLDTDAAGRPLWLSAYVVGVLAYWFGLSVAVAVILWRAGTGQPTLARRRMRLLAAASVVLGAALLPSVQAESDRSEVVVAVTAVLPVLAAILFYAGFSPPRTVRLLWRQREQSALREAELEIMQATAPGDVAAVVLPHVVSVLGAHAAVLCTDEGELIGTHGVDRDEGEALVVAADAGEVMSLRLAAGRLVVQASPYTPFFGEEELGLLRGLGVFLDLALERSRLLEGERAARQAVESANAELETLLYGISHDLRSPIITVVGYLEYLQADHADKLDDDARHYLRRMAASARYMEDLLRDLLELSRIGRVQTDAEAVDLQVVAEEVAGAVATRFPQCSVSVCDLPVVAANPVRMRQLLTNLVENAASHGGRPDVAVSIDGRRDEVGDWQIVVSDNGRGIPAEDRAKVFGIFERLEPAQSATSGTGIGLALCKKIVESIGGSIVIDDSTAGATFVLTLPARVARTTRPRQEATS